MDIDEINKEVEKLKEQLFSSVAKSQENIKEAQEGSNVVKETKDEAKKSQEEFADIILKIILLYYLLGYKAIDKKAKELPDEHKKLAETYADEVVQTYGIRMSQMIQDAVVYKATENSLKLLSRLSKETKDAAKKTTLVPSDIGVKFAGRRISLENYTKMITNTAQQTAKVNGTINKGIQESIMIYERVERIDGKTCKICRARDGEKWDVSKQGIPPALFHPYCRGYWKPVI